jgi:cobalt-zinc-cadmium efflux system protein
LQIALGLAAAYMVAEVVGGLWTGSLALLADAGHMFSDVAALSLSLFAIWVAQRPATSQRTFGYYRAEILAALVHGGLLIAVAIYIVLEAVERMGEPPEILGGPMMVIAAGGLAVNLIGLWILGEGRAHSLNVRGAWLHVLSDALGSVGAVIAGGLVVAFGWNWADPIASLGIALLVVLSSWTLLGEAVGVLLEGAPRHIDVDEVRGAILDGEGVLAVHDLHIWTIASGLVSLSCHVVAKDGPDGSTLLSGINQLLRERFGIDHTTIQLEPEGFDEGETCE